MFIDGFYFNSFGCPPPANAINQITRVTYPANRIQKYSASYCSWVLYLTQIIGFENAVLSLYNQTLS